MTTPRSQGESRSSIRLIPLAERWDHDLCLRLVHDIADVLAPQSVEAYLEEGYLQIRGLQESQLTAGLELLAQLARQRAERITATAGVSDTGHVQLPAGAWTRWGDAQRTIGQAGALLCAVQSLVSSDANLA